MSWNYYPTRDVRRDEIPFLTGTIPDESSDEGIATQFNAAKSAAMGIAGTLLTQQGGSERESLFRVNLLGHDHHEGDSLAFISVNVTLIQK